MDTKEMARAVRAIGMPDGMEERVLRACYREIEEKNMKHNISGFRRPAVVFAAFIMCFLCLGVTGMAASEKLQGYFRDIKDFRGAVTGETYEQADDEITVTSAAEGNGLKVHIVFEKPDAFPYSLLEELAASSYTVRDSAGKEVLSGVKTELFPVENGGADIIVAADLPEGKYTLVITELEGYKKAEQPLAIRGEWTCVFEK